MFLFLNSVVASLDGLMIGIGLRLEGIKITKNNILTILVGNFMIYTFFLFLYYHFHFTFMTRNITTILYLILAWNAYRNNESIHMKTTTLDFLNCLFITLTHSLDGTIISLNFVYNYSLMHIASIFSIMSLFILLVGYYFAKVFKNQKENYISTFLFLLLAFINQFL